MGLKLVRGWWFRAECPLPFNRSPWPRGGHPPGAHGRQRILRQEFHRFAMRVSTSNVSLP